MCYDYILPVHVCIILQVTFLCESAVDIGGLRREFFRLFSHNSKDRLLIGRDDFKFFCAVQVSKMH